MTVPSISDHQVELTIFVALFAFVTILGFGASHWRRPAVPHSLEQWGLGGRAFGNWVTWFLLGGELYTAYTFVAVPALVYAIGAGGFFAVPFAAITLPIVYIFLTRLWSISHVYGFVTPAEFVRARFGSRTLSLLIAIAGILATMPYIALQLIGLEAVLKVMGVTGPWPLTIAFAVLAAYTYNSGLRAPALISIVKDVLLLWTVIAVLVVVATTLRGWSGIFDAASAHFAATPNPGDGLLLTSVTSHINYLTLVLGSALALFLYPHATTGVLAARNRATIKRNTAGLPVYTVMLGLIAMLGLVAIAYGVKPIAGDRNTIVPVLFDTILPNWCAGIALAAIGIGAIVPAAVMSIAAANLFTRCVYREFIRPGATAAQETRISKWASLWVKLGAVAVIVFLSPQFSIDLQLVGGVVMLQALPAMVIGLYSAWPHRWALVAGLLTGLVTGLIMLYQIPQVAADGRVLREHFGGAGWPLSNLGFDTTVTVYAGLLALAANLAVTVTVTIALRSAKVPAGVDITLPQHYTADEGDPQLRRMSELVDGVRHEGAHALTAVRSRDRSG
ncbi:MAG TPA: sodium:solute symporter family protein [Pilimelia sp.]|nr:sodium:solute symporter family protein [Pilimelia sp.]